MSNLISKADGVLLTGSYNDFFDTFKKKIVVYKEPIKVAANINSQSMYGYETESNETNYTYTLVSGIFYGIISSSDSAQENNSVESANINYNAPRLKLKVEQDARDYILNNKTEKIEVENHNYNVVGGSKKLSLLSKNYFIFEMEEMY